MQFKLEGFPELEAALAEVATKSTRVVVTRRALALAARPMLSKAKLYAPIDDGELERSIKISTRATGEVGNAAYHSTIKGMAEAAKAAGESFSLENAKGFAVSAMRDARRAFRAVNPPAILYLGPVTGPAFYAKFVELGTRARVNGGVYRGTMHPGTSPQPFLRPAFDSEAKATIDRLAPLIWVEIDKTAKRAARRAAKAAGG